MCIFSFKGSVHLTYKIRPQFASVFESFLRQMLLQKLRGSHCCLLDVAPFPLGELGGLKVSRSGVDSGIGESVATGSLTHSATAPPADRPQSPAPKNHSATLHNLVQLCLQQQPECRSPH